MMTGVETCGLKWKNRLQWTEISEEEFLKIIHIIHLEDIQNMDGKCFMFKTVSFVENIYIYMMNTDKTCDPI